MSKGSAALQMMASCIGPGLAFPPLGKGDTLLPAEQLWSPWSRPRWASWFITGWELCQGSSVDCLAHCYVFRARHSSWYLVGAQ